MEDWSALFEGKVFITDLGISPDIEVNGSTMTLGRYAVFSPNKGQPGHQAIEVGGDLEALRRKYGVTADCVCVVDTGEVAADGTA